MAPGGLHTGAMGLALSAVESKVLYSDRLLAPRDRPTAVSSRARTLAAATAVAHGALPPSSRPPLPVAGGATGVTMTPGAA